MAAAILFICRLPTVLFSPFFSWFRCLHIVGGISMEYALIALTNYDECGIVYCSGRNKQRKRMKGVWKNWPPAFCFFTHFMRCGLLSYNWGGGEVWINSPFFTYLWLNNYLPQWHIHVWQQLNSLHYFDPGEMHNKFNSESRTWSDLLHFQEFLSYFYRGVLLKQHFVILGLEPWRQVPTCQYSSVADIHVWVMCAGTITMHSVSH